MRKEIARANIEKSNRDCDCREKDAYEAYRMNST
jgi:hypothetical protein